MPQPKYQIFVSSTFEDLKSERDQVIKAILEMGHIPVGMEMFSAADDEQWRIIARHIDESDYYCVIVAHRYGSITDGVSYTQKEYEYAVSQGVPALGFVIDNDVAWPAKSMDKASGTVAKLNGFKQLVRKKPVSVWKSADDLYGKVGIALGKQIAMTPRPGWIRTPPGASADVTKELTRLSAENARLRDEVERAAAKAESDQASEVRKVWTELNKHHRKLSYRHKSGDRSWQMSEETALTEYFYIVAPELATESEVRDLANTLAMEIRNDKERRDWDIVALNQVRSLLNDLTVFGLVEPSTKKHSVHDDGEYWTLTDLGRELNKMLRMQILSVEAQARAAVGGANQDAAAKKAATKKAATKKAATKKAATKKAATKKKSGSD